MESNQNERDVRRRREEQRRLAQRRQEQKKKKNKKLHNLILFLMIGLLVIGGLIVAAYTFLFPVSTIEIRGNQRYAKDMIIQSCGVESGSNLLRVDPQTVEDNIRKICPYILDVTVQRKLPSLLIISVKEGGPTLAFCSGEKYILTTDRYEYIETASDPGEAMTVYGVSVTHGDAGKAVTFSDTKQQGQLNQLVTEIIGLSITDITKIDFTDSASIRILYKNLHVWNLGDLSNMNYKLRFGLEVSSKEKDSGTIDLSWLTADNKDAYFKNEVLGDFMGADLLDQPKYAICDGEDYHILSASFEYLETTDTAKGLMSFYGIDLSDDEGCFVWENDSQKQILTEITTWLNQSGVTFVKKIDLSHSSMIRLQYKDLHVWYIDEGESLSEQLTVALAESKNQSGCGVIQITNDSAEYVETEELEDITQPLIEQEEESSDDGDSDSDNSYDDSYDDDSYDDESEESE